jgi:hypothetical protein
LFRVDGLAPGHYQITAKKPQFTSQTTSTADLDLTSSKDNVRLSLVPLGVITGKVVDGKGEPVAFANVAMVKFAVSDGMRYITLDRHVQTNDRGVYRFWNVEEGKFYVEATGFGGATSLFAGDTTPMYLADEGFPAVYFGGASTLGSARPVEMVAGAESLADLSVAMEHTYKIRGSLGNFVPRRGVTFQLSRGGDEVTPGRVNVRPDQSIRSVRKRQPTAHVQPGPGFSDQLRYAGPGSLRCRGLLVFLLRGKPVGTNRSDRLWQRRRVPAVLVNLIRSSLRCGGGSRSPYRCGRSRGDVSPNSLASDKIRQLSLDCFITDLDRFAYGVNARIGGIKHWLGNRKRRAPGVDAHLLLFVINLSLKG